MAHYILIPLRWVAEYLFINLTAMLAGLIFCLTQRIRVYGLKNMVYQTNVIVASNHQTFVDSFLVGPMLFFPRSLVQPHLIPWHLAASENFFKTGFYALMGRLWHAIPVRPGRKDTALLHRLTRELPGKVIHFFPEGTRSRDGSISEAAPGFGIIIYRCRPTVIPVRIIGMDRVQPVGHKMLGGQIFAVKRLFQKVTIIVGPPVELSDLLDQPYSREVAWKIGSRVMSTIRSLEPPVKQKASGQ